jgi:hypothetical protein
MYRKRLKGYANNAYQLQSPTSFDLDETNSKTPNTIFNGTNFSSQFFHDLSLAQQSVLIYVPSIYVEKAACILHLLQEKQHVGYNVQLFTCEVINSKTNNQLDLFSISPLEELSVTKQESIFMQCAIIDRKILWYGDINYLGTNTKYNYSMRLVDSSIAEQIINLFF